MTEHATLLKEATKLVDDEVLTFKEKQFKMADHNRKQKNLPVPVGYRILVAMPEVESKTAGGIIKAQETVQVEKALTVWGLVISMGPDAYTDKTRFPSGPLCEVGDFILFRAYTGTRIKVSGKELRLLNDDSVEATIDDPRGVTKV